MLDTFHDCINEAEKFLKENNIECSEFSDHLFTGGVSYSEKRTWNFPIERVNGKFTKLFFHFIIYRNDRGYYEPICYAL